MRLFTRAFLTILVVLVVSISLAHSATVTAEKDTFGVFASDEVTGTSANTYPSPAQAEWTNAYRFEQKTVHIINTDGTNSLDYKVTLQVSPTATEHNYANHTDQTLTNGSDAYIDIPEFAWQVNVYIKSTTTDTPATFSIQVGGKS